MRLFETFCICFILMTFPEKLKCGPLLLLLLLLVAALFEDDFFDCCFCWCCCSFCCRIISSFCRCCVFVFNSIFGLRRRFTVSGETILSLASLVDLRSLASRARATCNAFREAFSNSVSDFANKILLFLFWRVLLLSVFDWFRLLEGGGGVCCCVVDEIGAGT